MLRPTADGSGEPLVVHVFDLSMHGVGFSCARPLEIGTVFRFSMSDRRRTASRVEVCRCRARPDGMFDVGAQFC
jgi:hypothetical protein